MWLLWSQIFAWIKTTHVKSKWSSKHHIITINIINYCKEAKLRILGDSKDIEDYYKIILKNRNYMVLESNAHTPSDPIHQKIHPEYPVSQASPRGIQSGGICLFVLGLTLTLGYISSLESAIVTSWHMTGPDCFCLLQFNKGI